MGLSCLDSCLVTEEIAWGCSGIGTSIMANDLGLMPIVVAGSEEQKKEWLAPLAESFQADRLLPLGARRRLRRGRALAEGRARRRRLRAERHQVLDHERR